MKNVSVHIPLATTWPTREEIAARDKVTDALNSNGIGKMTGAGGGMGEMDFSFQVADESTARSEIDRAMHEHMPGAVYRVRVTE